MPTPRQILGAVPAARSTARLVRLLQGCVSADSPRGLGPGRQGTHQPLDKGLVARSSPSAGQRSRAVQRRARLGCWLHHQARSILARGASGRRTRLSSSAAGQAVTSWPSRCTRRLPRSTQDAGTPRTTVDRRQNSGWAWLAAGSQLAAAIIRSARRQPSASRHLELCSDCRQRRSRRARYR